MSLFKWLERSESVAALAVLFITPFLLGGGPLEAVSFINIVALFGAMMLFSKHCFFRTRPVSLELRNAFGLAAVFAAAAVLFAVAQSFGGTQVPSRGGLGSIAPSITLRYAAQYSIFAILFVLFFDCLRGRKSVDVLSVGLAGVVGFLVLISSYQEVSEAIRSLIGKFMEASNDRSFFSTFTNPNHFGGYVLLANFFFLANVIYFFRNPVKQWQGAAAARALVFTFVAAIGVWSMLKAGARAALISQVVACIVLSAVFVGHAKGVIGKAVVFLGLLSAAALVYSRIPGLDILHLSWDRLLGDLSGRIDVQRQMTAIVQDFPWFGTGLGTSRFITSRYQIIDTENWTWPHLFNQHLEILAETGPFGYALFTAPVVVLVWGALPRVLRRSSVWSRTFGFTSFLAVAATVAVSLIDDYLVTPAVTTLFLLHLALMTSAACRSTSAPAPSSLGEPRPRPVISPARLALWAGAIALFAMLMRESALDLEAFLLRRSQDVSSLRHAARLRPNDPDVLLDAGEALYWEAARRRGAEFRRVMRETVEIDRRALRLAPTNPRSWTQLGRALILAGEREKGMMALLEAMKWFPRNRDLRIFAAAMCLRLEHETPWKDERIKFRRLAERLIRPILPSWMPFEDWRCDYFSYYHDLSETDRRLLIPFVRRLIAVQAQTGKSL